MIAQIKVLANAKAIEAAQKEAQKTAQENAQLAKAKRLPLKGYPEIPEMEYKDSDLLIDAKNVSLAFVNSNGEISIKYQGDNFNLVYNEEVWRKLNLRFDETRSNQEKAQLTA